MSKGEHVVRGTIIAVTEFTKILIVLFAVLFIANLQIGHGHLPH